MQDFPYGRAALSLAQLETFVAVVDSGTFTRAAERLHLTQPAVTQQIRALQDRLGVRLFDLHGRRIRLTDAGTFTLERARYLLGVSGALVRDLHEFGEARIGTLAIGATDTIGTYALPTLLRRFRTVAPRIDFAVTIENTTAIVAAVRAGRLGIGLIEGDASGDDLACTVYPGDCLRAYGPIGHPLADGKPHAAQELDGVDFVKREAGSGTRAIVDAWLADYGASVRTALELSSGEAVLRAVSAGLGMTIVSTHAADLARRAGRIATIEIEMLPLARTFRTIRLHAATAAPTTRAFIALLDATPMPFELDESARGDVA